MFSDRLWRLFALVVVGLAVVLGRLAWVQVISPDAGLPEQTRRRQYYSETVEPFRGDIVSREGTLLATDALTFDIEIHYTRLRASAPRWLADASAAASAVGVDEDINGAVSGIGDDRVPEWAFRLAGASGVGVQEIMDRRRVVLNRVQRVKEHVLNARPALRRIRGFRIKEETVPHVILPNVPFDVAARIEARRDYYDGLHVGMRRRRHYPQGELASHVIGRLGEVERGREPQPPKGVSPPPEKEYLPGDDYGILGVEKQYDWHLRGSRGRRWFRRQPSPMPDKLDREEPARPGETLELALDARAQRVAEEALAGRAGAVFVMDVRTGEVLVCASSPGYDLNLSGSALAALFDQRPGPFLNRAMRDAVPGGSVVKIASAVAGVETGVINPAETMHCEAVYRIGQWEFTCQSPHGRLGLSEAIARSCNVFFFAKARPTGPDALAEWARKLGLGRRTGIDLPYEQPGRFPDPEWARTALGRAWYPGDTLNTCIGQGDVQITPAQTAVMMAAIANGGKVLVPRVAKLGQSAGGGGESATVARTLEFSPEGLRIIREGMGDVSRTGTARHVEGLAEMEVAGKTGTAETHEDKVNHAWFAGYAPLSEPVYAFAVVVHRTHGTGGGVAAPVARDVLRVLMRGGFPES